MRHICAKTAILRDRQWRAKFSAIPPNSITTDFIFPLLRFARARIEVARVAKSDESHLRQKRPFRGSADGGRIVSDFHPTLVRRLFIFWVFAFLRDRAKVISGIATPDVSHLCQKRTLRGGADGGRNSVLFSPTPSTAAFYFPILRYCAILRKKSPESPHPKRRIFVKKRTF